MNRHERRKAKVMQLAIARANKKAVGMMCIGEIVRDPNTCVEDFLSRLRAIVNKLGDSEFAVVVEPGKVAFPETHEVCPFVRFMVHDDEIFVATECVEPIAQHIDPILDFYVNLSTAASETACGSVDAARSKVILSREDDCLAGCRDTGASIEQSPMEKHHRWTGDCNIAADPATIRYTFLNRPIGLGDSTREISLKVYLNVC